MKMLQTDTKDTGNQHQLNTVVHLHVCITNTTGSYCKASYFSLDKIPDFFLFSFLFNVPEFSLLEFFL